MEKGYISGALLELSQAVPEIRKAAIETGSVSLYRAALEAFSRKEDFVKKLLR